MTNASAIVALAADEIFERARQRVDKAMHGGGRPPQRTAGVLVRRRQRPLPEETR